MEIKLTKEQYENLLKLVYLGNWMINAVRTGAAGDEHIERFEDMESYIFSYAASFGLDENALYDEKSQAYFPTRTFEDDEELQGYIDEYNERSFWEALVDRLAERDAIKKHGDAYYKMGWEERFDAVAPFEERYIDEFSKHELDNVRIEDID